MNQSQFELAVGTTAKDVADLWYPPFLAAISEFNMTDPLELASFFSVGVGHESKSLNKLEEDLNYGPQAMMRSWPSRFPTLGSCNYYAHNPERLANQVYGGRFGNGSFVSGDGWKYRGQGPIQITFADTYRACGKFLNLDLIGNPALLKQPSHGSRASCWFWRVYKKIHLLPDLTDVRAVTKKIQGGDAGLADRTTRFSVARIALGA